MPLIRLSRSSIDKDEEGADCQEGSTDQPLVGVSLSTHDVSQDATRDALDTVRADIVPHPQVTLRRYPPIGTDQLRGKCMRLIHVPRDPYNFQLANESVVIEEMPI